MEVMCHGSVVERCHGSGVSRKRHGKRCGGSVTEVMRHGSVMEALRKGVMEVVCHGSVMEKV